MNIEENARLRTCQAQIKNIHCKRTLHGSYIMCNLWGWLCWIWRKFDESRIQSLHFDSPLLRQAFGDEKNQTWCWEEWVNYVFLKLIGFSFWVLLPISVFIKTREVVLLITNHVVKHFNLQVKKMID